MTLSTATISSQNLDLGPCKVTYNGVDLGATLGNAKITYKYALSELKADQLGSTPLDHRVSGLVIQVTTELAETQNKANWKVIFPSGNFIGSNPYSFRHLPSIGDSQVANAHALVLHPLNKGAADYSSDYTFYLAAASQESEIDLSPSAQTKMKIVWNVYPNLSVTGYPMALFGDPAIGLINAAAGAPSFSGTGNGTLTLVTAYNGYTKSETITIKCIAAAANGGTFLVTGSISGVLGDLVLPGTIGGAANFSSNPISFTITDGTSDFVVNDQWTVATTAANYV